MSEASKGLRLLKRSEKSNAGTAGIKAEAPISPVVSKVSHKSTACLPCRKKRRRCNGSEEVRCSECIRHDLHCVFDKESDGRRRPQRERVKKDQALLHKLFDAIKTWPEQDIAPLIQAIHHEDASVGDLELYFEGTANLSGKDDEVVEKMDISESQPSSAVAEEFAASPSESGRLTPFSVSLQDEDSAMRSESNRNFFVGAGSTAYEFSFSDAVLAEHLPPAVQREQITLISRAEYLCTPLVLDRSDEADHVARMSFDFLYSARGRIIAGQPITDILSMDGLDLELFFRQRHHGDPHNVSTWACEIAKTFSHQSMILQLNMVHSIGTFMRWLILPCRETWDQMNPLMRPLKSQVLTAHDSLYLDLCHIPQLRLAQLRYPGRMEALMAKSDWTDCHWNQSVGDCYERHDKRGFPQRLSSAFINHVNDVRNWTVHRVVLDCFPELRDSDNSMVLHGQG